MLRLAIPTYRRSQTIANKTLRYLNDQGYPPPLIYLFVASEEEKVEYENNVPFYLYGQIVVGVPGLMHQRNFITQYFDEGELLIEMDDDVESIYCMTGGFKDLVTYATNLLSIGQGGLFGVMPNDDKRTMSLQTTTHLAFIIGTFSIRRNHHSILITQVQKEDYERTILYFLRYRKVYRYKAAGVKTRYLKNAGGLQDGHRLETMEECVQYLCNTYYTIVRRREKNGLPDLTLNWRYK
jgi:hypothetical protein